MSGNAYVCIGDVHGCAVQLRELLDRVDQTYPDRPLVFLGDLVDRGPEPDAVIDMARDRGSIVLLGNHEQMLFALYDHADTRFDRERILSVRQISRRNHDWMRNHLITTYSDGEYLFSHAGLNPEFDLEDQSEDDYLWPIHEDSYENAPELLVVHGHHTVPEVTVHGNNINVDTGCGKGGYLSAIALPERQLLRSKTRSPRYSLWF